MARQKTENTPDNAVFLTPKNTMMLAVERAMLRGADWAHTSTPIAEQIAVRLATLIIMDQVHAGQRLIEKELSETLKVSRAPVREALRILERDRLIEFIPRRGAVVTAPDAQELHDIFRVRSVLYMTMLEDVIRSEPDQLNRLLSEQMPVLRKAAQDTIDTYVVASFLLNFEVINLCRNKLLIDVLHSISLRTLRYVKLGFVTDLTSIQASCSSWEKMSHAAREGRFADLICLASQRLDEAKDSAINGVESSSGS